MERKEADKRERKLAKQLERQQRKLAQKGIHVDLATLRAEWEGRQRRDEPEIDVVSTSESPEEVSDGAAAMVSQEASVAEVTKVRKAPLSLFSIESLLGVRQSEPEPEPVREPEPMAGMESVGESEQEPRSESMSVPMTEPMTESKLEVASPVAVEGVLQRPAGELVITRAAGMGTSAGLLRVADLSTQGGAPINES